MTALSAKVREDAERQLSAWIASALRADGWATGGETEEFHEDVTAAVHNAFVATAIAERLARVEGLEALLRAAVCPMAEHGCDGTQYPVGDPNGNCYGEQCQWCYERNASLPPPPVDAGGA